MTDYRIDYRNDTGEWENIENLGNDMSTGLDNEQDAIETFDSLMNDFDDEDEVDYRLVEIEDDGFEITIKEAAGE